MDILDELGLTGAVPEHPDFSLDEILAEFATPGLFASPEETVDAILASVDTPTDDEGVKVYAPKSKAEPAAAHAVAASDGETQPFTAVDLPETEQPQPKKKQRVSLKDRFAAKKASKAAQKSHHRSPAAQQPSAPAPEEAPLPISQPEPEADPDSVTDLDAWLAANSDLFAKKQKDAPKAVQASEPSREPIFVPEAPISMGIPMDMDYPDALPTVDPAASEAAPMPDLSPAPMEEQDTSEAAEKAAEDGEAVRGETDDDLHYVPEQHPIRVAISAVFKKLASAVNTVGSDEEGTDANALGEEVSPDKAAGFFSKYIQGYRFRLKLAAALCLPLGWISLGLPVFGSLKNPAVAAALCLMILLTVMLAGVDIFTVGFRTLLQRRPSVHSLVTLSCLASVLDAVIIILSKGEIGYLPFCVVSAVSMCFAIYGSLLYSRSQRMSFKTLEHRRDKSAASATPMTIAVDYGMVEKDTTSAYRTPGYPEEYIHRSEEEDLSESVHSVLAPILVIAIPVLSLVAALISRSMGDIFHILSGMFAAAASFTALLAFPVPYFLAQSSLFDQSSALAGWAGIRDLGQVSSMLITDRDLFPDSTIIVKPPRNIDNPEGVHMFICMCSVIVAADCCLSSAFRALAEKKGYELLPVENLTPIQSDALTCTIGSETVTVANYAYVKQFVPLRQEKRMVNNDVPLYVMMGDYLGHVYVEYNASEVKSLTKMGLEEAAHSPAEPVFAARNFHIDPKFISEKFETSADRLLCPSYQQRFAITGRMNADTAVCAAFTHHASLNAYVRLVRQAKQLYRTVTLNVTLSVISSLIGILLVFILTAAGTAASVTAGYLLTYMLPWLLLTLLSPMSR